MDITTNGKGTLVETLRTCWHVLFVRRELMVYMNAVFFGGLLVSTVVGGLLLRPGLYVNSHSMISDFFWGLNWPLMVLAIFSSNLVLSALLFVTLPGFVFFPFSACVLAYRAFLWGLLIAPLPKWAFLAALPTVTLEGEAYVLAAAAGTTVGLSWFKPKWAHASEASSRGAALRQAFKDCGKMYLFIILLLIGAAAVETATVLL